MQLTDVGWSAGDKTQVPPTPAEAYLGHSTCHASSMKDAGSNHGLSTKSALDKVSARRLHMVWVFGNQRLNGRTAATVLLLPERAVALFQTLT